MGPADSSLPSEEFGALDRPRTIHLLVIILCAVTFVADMLLDAQVATAVIYIIPVFISQWLANRAYTLWLAVTCVGLTFFRLVFMQAELSDAALQLVWIHAAVSTFAIGVTANLGLWRIAIEQELSRSRETFVTTLRSIGDAVLVVDAEERVTFLNDVAESLTGWEAGTAQGRPLGEVCDLVSGSLEGESVSGIFSTGRLRGERLRLRARDGRVIPVDRSAAPIQGSPQIPGGNVLVFRDMSERQAYEDAIKRLAFRDELTGLPNRTSFRDRLALEMAHARRNKSLIALLFMDLDGFKGVNDERGHPVGDALLKEVAARLREALREGDTVARFGGDEFTVIVPGLSRGEDGVLVADKILEVLRRPLLVEGAEMVITLSVGIALFPRDGEEAGSLIQCADAAMYRAKQKGGNQWCR